MKILMSVLSAAIGALLLSPSLAAQTPVGTAITYAQSNVKKGAVLVNGTWDVAFKLFTAASGGSQVGPIIFKNNVVFTSGTMPTQSLDFGPDAFNGEARFLELKVRQGANDFAAAGARQRLNAVPYALALRGLRTEEIAGGFYNVIGGSNDNLVTDGLYGATIAGGKVNTVMGNYGTIGGGANNTTSSISATVGGGSGNLASGLRSVVSGGESNDATGSLSAVLGGKSNTAEGVASMVGAGLGNHAIGQYASISGGWLNFAEGSGSTVAGGNQNEAFENYSTVAGGLFNKAGYGAAVCGGISNVASGSYSFAGGYKAKATHSGAFVWADSYNGNFNSFTTNSFNARATGGCYCYTNSAQTSGAIMSPGDGSWTNLSDRHHKRDIIPVNARDVLHKVVNMPVATWSYDSQERSIRHMGPMAQDFHAAFGLGTRETHITTVDADGVALAAIQGLHQMVEEKDAEIVALRSRLESLERMVQQLAANRTEPMPD